MFIITGPPNGPVLFCSLASVVCRRRLSRYVTLPAGGPADRRRMGGRRAGLRACWRSGGPHYTAGQYSYVPLGRHLVLSVPAVANSYVTNS